MNERISLRDILTLIMFSLALACLGCHKSQDASRSSDNTILSVNLYEAEPAYDFAASISWKGFDEASRLFNPEDREPFRAKVVYVWFPAEHATKEKLADECGAGAEGFAEVLRRLEMLPSGSVVKVHPNFLIYPLEPTGYIDRSFPFQEDWDRLVEVSSRRNIKLVFTVWDEFGKLDEVIRRDLDEYGMKHPIYVQQYPQERQ